MNKFNKSLFGLALAGTLLALCMVSANSAILPGTNFTPLQVDNMLTAIDNLFFVAAPTKNMEIRKFLRGAFHDCMGLCDGSINLNNTANRGLQKYTTLLYNTYNTLQTTPSTAALGFATLSRADFVALCNLRALAWGIKKSGAVPPYTSPAFKFGRVTTDPYNLDGNEGTVPDGVDSWQTMLNDISTALPTISEADMVALLGLHGSGTANFNNSGFQGPWGPTTDKNIVNNNFYINLLSYNYPGNSFNQVLASNAPAPAPTPNVDGGYVSQPPATNKVQWNHANVGNPVSPAKMMLPIDMQIYLSFTPTPTGAETSGDYCPQGNNASLYNCTLLNTPRRKYLPLAKNAPLALSFAKSNAVYIQALVPAFLRMINNAGTASLTAFTPVWGCSNHVAKCYGDVLFAGCAGAKPTNC